MCCLCLPWPAAELQTALEDGKLALKAREARIEELEAAAAAASESASEVQVSRDCGKGGGPMGRRS